MQKPHFEYPKSMTHLTILLYPKHVQNHEFSSNLGWRRSPPKCSVHIPSTVLCEVLRYRIERICCRRSAHTTSSHFLYSQNPTLRPIHRSRPISTRLKRYGWRQNECLWRLRLWCSPLPTPCSSSTIQLFEILEKPPKYEVKTSLLRYLPREQKPFQGCAPLREIHHCSSQ